MHFLKLNLNMHNSRPDTNFWALNKMFGAGYDKNFISGIKSTAINQYISNAQNIVQQLLLDVDRKEARELRKAALEQLKIEAKIIYSTLMRKYQSDLPLFKALAIGEKVLMAVNKVKTWASFI